MNIDYALTVEGYMDETDLIYLAGAASRSKLIVEIGCWKGKTTSCLAANTSGKVVAVDTWSGDLEHRNDTLHISIFSQFIENTKPYHNIYPLCADSVTAAGLLSGPFDMIFIDASHDYDSVKADILAWRPLLADGGILCGHDYNDQYPGVAQAVDELVWKVRLIDRIWTTELA